MTATGQNRGQRQATGATAVTGNKRDRGNRSDGQLERWQQWATRAMATGAMAVKAATEAVVVATGARGNRSYGGDRNYGGDRINGRNGTHERRRATAVTAVTSNSSNGHDRSDGCDRTGVTAAATGNRSDSSNGQQE